MKAVLNILSQIESTSARTEKENILKANKDNTLLKKTLEYTLNPYKVFNVGSKTFSDRFKMNEQTKFNSIFELMDWLLERNASDETKHEVNKFIFSQDEKDRDWYKRMLLKDLRVGITEKTVNKCIPNLIPSFDVMLAKKYEDYEHKINDEFVVTLKLDGVRVAILKENGTIQMFSRQGKPFEDFNELLEEIKLLPDNMVYDGELLLRNDKNLDSASLYRATMKEVSKDGEKRNVELLLFDIIPINEFKAGKSKKKYLARRDELEQTLSQIDLKLVKTVPVLYRGKDKNEIYPLLNKVTEDGYEGLMLNRNMEYYCKRTDAILKIKKFNVCDALCLDVIEGTGKNEGRLGSILIEFEHEGNKYTCHVGSGFSDHEREKYFNSPELIKGKIVEIGYFELSRNQNDDGYSMRFPTWKGRIRHDKDEISMY